MAEEQKLGSKKRRRQSFTADNPLVGIFTRSKAQIYVHRSRSGRSRFDSPHQDLNISQPLCNKSRRRFPTQDSSNVDDLSCVLIKDLRARRIFSTRLGLSEESGKGKQFEKGIGFGISESGFSCNSLCNRNVIGANGNPDGNNIKKLDVGLCSKDLNLNPRLFHEEPRKYEENNVSNGVGGLEEEPIQSTPPDNEVFIDSKEAEENGDQRVESIRKKQSDDSNQWNADINKRDGNNSRSNSSLRYRVKLFKAPGSFSYRRLLPYLMDISEDKSCGSKMGQSQKFEEGMDEKPQSTCHDQDVLINKSRRESCPAESNRDHVNKSKSRSIECIKESQKEPCMGTDFSHTSISMAKGWSKPIMSWGIDTFDIKTSSREPDFGPNHSVIKSTDDGGTAKIVVNESCNARNVNNLNCSVSLVLEKCNSGNDNEDGQGFEDTKLSKTGGSLEVNNLNLTNPNLPSRELNENSSDADQRDDESGEVQDRIDNSNKEYNQLTQPDDDIFGKLEAAETGGDSVECMHNGCNFLGKPLSGITYRNKNSVADKTIYSSPAEKLALNRCSRLKIFKTPGSIGYRRMLPFLMDLAKDNSKRLSPSQVSNCQEMSTESSNANDGHPQSQSAGQSALPIAVKLASSNNQERSNESPKPLHSQQETDAHSEQDVSDTARKFDTGPEIMDIIHGSNLPVTSLCSLSNSGSFLEEGARQALQALSLKLEEDCNKSITVVTDDAKQIETESLLQYSFHRSSSFCLNIPATISKKGILKRTPQGCRGLCTCLNCSSFRLHAEKAFDFSRNQMQDAEEVILDLIKELSYARNTLEKSTFNADGHALVCASQVKEACRRTCEAEELALHRLSQMNFDLNIQCRVTCPERPRVTFANYVEEKIITKPDLPSEYRLIRTEKKEHLC